MLSGEAVLELRGEAVHKPSSEVVLELSGEAVHELSTFRQSMVKLTWNMFASSQPGVSNGAVSVAVALA